MISQISNAGSQVDVVAPQPRQPVAEDIAAKQTSTVVELPRQAVKEVDTKVTIDTVKSAAQQINKVLQQFDRNLQFSVDSDTGINVVKVIDTQSKDVIRQMPTQEMLAIAKALDKLQGLIIRAKA